MTEAKEVKRLSDGSVLLMNTAKALTEEPPRSPRDRLGGYALMARMIDKGRADIQGTVGEYHYACPLDQMLFEFKGVQPDEVKKLLASGAADEQVVTWFDSHGTARTAEKSRHGQMESKAIVPTTIRKEGLVFRGMHQAGSQARELDLGGLSRGG